MKLAMIIMNQTWIELRTSVSKLSIAVQLFHAFHLI